MNKKCSMCGHIKPLEHFSKDSRRRDGRIAKCKDCYSLYKNKWAKTPKGWANAVYVNQINNSKRRGHTPPSYSKKELLDWAFSNNLESLLHNWESNDFDPLLRPSVDRINESYGYTLNNIRLVTWQQNHERNSQEVLEGKPTPRTRRCRKLSLDGQVLAEYPSVSEAARCNGLRRSAISNVCTGRKNKTGGFRWEHIH